jgi:hypothetical protein
MLQERELHLEGVLVKMGPRVIDEARVGRQQLGSQVFRDRNAAERRLERAACPEGDTVERGAVRRPDEDGGERRPAAQEAVPVRRDRPRVPQAGVRADERDQPAGNGWRNGGGEIAIDFGGDGRG